MADALPNISGVTLPCKIVERSNLQGEIEEFSVLCRNTTKPLEYLCENEVSLEAAIEMARAIRGGADALEEKPYFIHGVTPLPLRFPREHINQIFRVVESGVPLGMGTVTIGGATTPITIAGSLVHAFAGDVETVAVEVQRGDERLKFDLEPETLTECDFGKLGVLDESGSVVLDYARILRKRSFSQAFKDGMAEPIDIGILTFQLLYKLVVAEESTKGLAGPVGIFKVSYDSAALAPGNLLWLLALITVNLGIFNLLPIPVLDGGHILLLGIEKIRGEAPSDKFVAIFQYVGLVFLLSLIVFVTYNDINRLLGG